MMSLTFGLFTQVSGSGPLGPLVLYYWVTLTLVPCGSGSVYSTAYFKCSNIMPKFFSLLQHLYILKVVIMSFYLLNIRMLFF